MEKHPDDLYMAKQRDTEIVHNYVARFNKGNVLFPTCIIDTAISTFRKRLRKDSYLYTKLTKYLCKTTNDALNKA